ncbi:MAG: MFS transporter [Clostridiaceae bacterium]|jgi:MFS family permease|nr:MFS transporter [Clostridiaceae bacterium]
MKSVTKNYQWIIIASLFIVLAVNWGIVFNSSGVFIIPIQTQFGTSRAAMLMGLFIRGIVSVITTLIGGQLIDRFGVLRVMRIASLILAVSSFAFAGVNSIGLYYLVMAIQVMATVLTGFLPCSILVNDWFPGKNAIAMSIAFMGSGFGGMLFNFLGGRWIAGMGWQTAALLFAIVISVILIPLAFFVLKNNPDQGVRDNIHMKMDLPGISFVKARRSFKFWALIAVFAINCICASGVINNLTPSFQDIGYSLEKASLITSIAMVCMSIGKLSVGFFFDRLGLRRTTFFANLSLLACLAGLVYGQHIIGVVIALAGFIMGAAYISVAGPVLAYELYGQKDYPKISSFIQTAFNSGGVIAPLIIAALYTQSNSYRPSWILFAVMITGSLFVYHRILPKHHAQTQEKKS